MNEVNNFDILTELSRSLQSNLFTESLFSNRRNDFDISVSTCSVQQIHCFDNDALFANTTNNFDISADTCSVKQIHCFDDDAFFANTMNNFDISVDSHMISEDSVFVHILFTDEMNNFDISTDVCVMSQTALSNNFTNARSNLRIFCDNFVNNNSFENDIQSLSFLSSAYV